MGPQLEAIVEPDQQILALCIHGRDPLPDDPMDLRYRPRSPRPGRQDGSAHEKRSQPGGGSVERVALGHGSLPSGYRVPRRVRPR